MGIRPTPYTIGKGQSPVDCKVYGQPRVFTLRPLVLPAIAVMVVACGLIVGLMAVAS